MDRVPGPEPALRERREQTIARLCEHFAHDDLTLEELERRIDVAQRAQDRLELEGLLQDLTPRTPAVAGPAATPATRTSPGAPPVPFDRKENALVVAIMGAAIRRGHWRPAGNTFVLSLMGGAELDFREAQLPPGVTEVFVFACMGGAEVLVPPGLAVESNGIAIMGGFDHQSPAPVSPDVPILRINGLALMGGVEVIVRRPGETAKDAKLRQREERRQLRNRDR